MCQMKTQYKESTNAVPLESSKNCDNATLVLDIGKTNVKMLVISKTGQVLETERLENKSLEGPPYPHLDTEGIWNWLLLTIPAFVQRYTIDAIVPTTHGCTAALISNSQLALPVIDYETELPDDASQDFEAIAPEFSETQSPNLPGGMNLGRHLFWMQRDFPQEFAYVDCILTYPQYWSWRLSGVSAGELTSIGCHGHLWNPQEGCYSSLVKRQKWNLLLPPIRPAYEALGRIRPNLAERTGLPSSCQIYNGIHDSNAAYSLYLRGHSRPFSLVSTGTWIVMISPRLPLNKLNKNRDTLALVDIMGDPAPTARYMGGREFELLIETIDNNTECSESDIKKVLAKKSFLLPSYAPGGPYMDRPGSTVGPELQSDGEIIARATIYTALMTVTSLNMLEVDGDLMIDGGFVNNPFYCRLIAALSKCEQCFVNYQTEGTAVGAGMLAVWDRKDIEWPLSLRKTEPFVDQNLKTYVREWRRLVDN